MCVRIYRCSQWKVCLVICIVHYYLKNYRIGGKKKLFSFKNLENLIEFCNQCSNHFSKISQVKIYTLQKIGEKREIVKVIILLSLRICFVSCIMFITLKWVFWNLVEKRACWWNCEVYDLERREYTALQRQGWTQPWRLRQGSDLARPRRPCSSKVSFHLTSPFTLRSLRSTEAIATATAQINWNDIRNLLWWYFNKNAWGRNAFLCFLLVCHKCELP